MALPSLPRVDLAVVLGLMLLGAGTYRLAVSPPLVSGWGSENILRDVPAGPCDTEKLGSETIQGRVADQYRDPRTPGRTVLVLEEEECALPVSVATVSFPVVGLEAGADLGGRYLEVRPEGLLGDMVVGALVGPGDPGARVRTGEVGRLVGTLTAQDVQRDSLGFYSWQGLTVPARLMIRLRAHPRTTFRVYSAGDIVLDVRPVN